MSPAPRKPRTLRREPDPGVHAVFDDVERAIPEAFAAMPERARLLLHLRFVVIEDRGVTAPIIAGPPTRATVDALPERDRAEIARALRAAANALDPT